MPVCVQEARPGRHFRDRTAAQGPHMGDLIIADKVKLTGTADIVVGGADLRAVSPPRQPLYD